MITTLADHIPVWVYQFAAALKRGIPFWSLLIKHELIKRLHTRYDQERIVIPDSGFRISAQT